MTINDDEIYSDIYRSKENISKEAADILINKFSEDKAMRKFLGSMDNTYNEKELSKSWDAVLDEDHEKIYNSTVVNKPEFVRRREELIANMQKGFPIDKLPKPLKDYTLVRLIKERHITSSIIIVETKTKDDTGYVAVLNDDSEYDFSLNDKVLFKTGNEKYRFRYEKNVYVLIHKDQILGIYD